MGNIYSSNEEIRKIQQGMRQSFYLAGKAIVKESRRLINLKPKSGRTYIVKVGIGGKPLAKARRHVASAPGEAPAVITGDLRKSVDFKVHGHTILEIGANTEYARELEYGTNKMAARPYLKPAIQSERQNLINYFGNELKGV